LSGSGAVATAETSIAQSGGVDITGPVAVGISVTDHAVIVGADGFGDVTGTVNFFICNPSQTSGTAGNERCQTGGSAAGSVAATPIGSSPPKSTAASSP
jgi:hypothetical protein